MSSWIPSLFNPFSDDDNPTSPDPPSPNKTTPRSPSSGAKDDISAVFRGVAAFLAPPQPTSLPGPSSSSEKIAGIRNDLAEIQGSFRSGLSLVSSKLTSNLLQFQSQLNDGDDDDEVEDDEEEDVVGINEEVLDFVEKISGRPELWIDFLSLPDDFDLSDYQREHAANIDHLVPEFVTLRQKICSQMSDGKFWLIYFILLLPRLNEEDSSFSRLHRQDEEDWRTSVVVEGRLLELIILCPVCLLLLLVNVGDLEARGDSGIADARETLMSKLQNKTDVDQETSDNPDPSDTSNDSSGNLHSAEGDESASQHKDATETVNPSQQRDNIVNEETESGRHSEDVDTSTSIDAQKQKPENEEDVSFSDLEDDDSDSSDKLSGHKESKKDKVWVQLNENSGTKQKADQYALRENKSEGEDSNDWLTVDDTDFDNLAAI
ncbi:hypothetical protein DH2020_030767 [Rehmannia glutinosa]|uniref:BSD domain-containing protein n=1 Tax=Rehmannia glutinosa TaxID=99300 RepID=A0ABR0VMD1_REHGL